MKAITLWQPWAWAIMSAGKRVENRSWPAPRALVGQRIAIHAGMRVDEWGIEVVEEITDAPVPTPLTTGAIVGTARVTGCVRAANAEVMTSWHFGPWCWELEDVRALEEPVPCKGRQGLWDLPPEVEAEIERQELGGAPA